MNNTNKPKATAWMIRRDGKAISCIHHIYSGMPANEEKGFEPNLDETLYAAEWLYKNSLDEQTKYTCLRLIASYGVSLHPQRNAVRSILLEIKEKPYVFLTRDFVMSVIDELPYHDLGDITRLSEMVTDFLNQEFMRARYGGMYNTETDCKDMYFRISSDGFDWFSVIDKFIKESELDINTVTIIRDEESTGESWYYKDEAGNEFNQIKLKNYLENK